MQPNVPFTLFLTSIVLTASLFSSQDDWSFNNHWTVFGDYVRMKRTHIKDKALVNGGGKRMGTKQTLARFGFEPGYCFGIFYHQNKANSFDANYLHLTEWDSSSHVTKNGQLYVPFAMQSTLSDYFNGTHAHEEYESRFDTAALNWWHHFTPRRDNFFAFSTILGFRYFRIYESFDFAMTKGMNKSTYDIHTKNRLYGGQIGGSFQWNPLDNLSWELVPRAGVFFNDLEQKTFLRDLNDTVTLAKFTRAGTAAAFLGEVLLLGRYQFGRYISIHLGYHLMYLDGLALAPEQFSLKTSAAYHARLVSANAGTSMGTFPVIHKRLSRDGIIMIHGGFAGLDISF